MDAIHVLTTLFQVQPDATPLHGGRNTIKLCDYYIPNFGLVSTVLFTFFIFTLFSKTKKGRAHKMLAFLLSSMMNKINYSYNKIFTIILLSTIRDADVILVMINGNVIESMLKYA